MVQEFNIPISGNIIRKVSWDEMNVKDMTGLYAQFEELYLPQMPEATIKWIIPGRSFTIMLPDRQGRFYGSCPGGYIQTDVLPIRMKLRTRTTRT